METAVGHVARAHEGRAAEDRQEERVWPRRRTDRRLIDLSRFSLLAIDGEGGCGVGTRSVFR